jgi:putative flippase GtrA
MIRLLRYFFVGGVAAICDIGLFSIFAGYFGWPWFSVSVITFIFATLVNYFLSIRFVFESGARYKKHFEIAAVYFVSALALAVNQLVLYFAIEVLGWNLIASKLLATSIVFFWNYLGRSIFIF